MLILELTSLRLRARQHRPPLYKEENVCAGAKLALFKLNTKATLELNVKIC